MWSLQLELLSWAETLFGIRDPSRILCQPCFHNSERPEIRFTLDDSGAFAVLGCDAKRDWSYAVYQLAHETVHLLNPVKLGQANYLEEGVAVAMSLHVSRIYGFSFLAPSSSKYGKALKLVNKLPEGAILSARRIRREVGRFSAVSTEDLLKLYPPPALDPAIANALTTSFDG